MYVYILRSKSHPSEVYVGVTPDIQTRLAEHNAGLSLHTAKFIPWELESYFWFSNDQKAFRFEQYLKSGSGRAFRSKHL